MSAKPKISEDKWEALKANGMEVSMAQLHQAVSLFQNSNSTISAAKFPDIKMWWTVAGLLCEFRGKRELIPVATVGRVVVLN